MPMAEKIRIALIKRNMTLKDLAARIGCTSQNLSGKFRRDNLSEKELIEIASALDCHFEGRFIRNDNGEEI
ncbi:helix-turn-helix domain-containing protein [Candidatus Avoscillospira sp. LCP25S3_F1]|uniref:helix-turn-helix domain-containing protein n=1 Tax=Candidatus Avoscillospira sp. LCP25S3_F1 TaxID=3438825 RepID=UPI003F93E9BB